MAANAARRNRLVPKLSSALIVIHAGPSSTTLSLCQRGIAQRKSASALESPHNAQLARLRATMVTPDEVTRLTG